MKLISKNTPEIDFHSAISSLVLSSVLVIIKIYAQILCPSIVFTQIWSEKLQLKYGNSCHVLGSFYSRSLLDRVPLL